MPGFKIALTAAALLASAGGAMAQPRLIGRGEPQCREAYELAVSAFRSTNSALHPPLQPPPGFGGRFAIYRTKEDISGGRALAHDADAVAYVAARLGDEEANDRVFFQKAPRDGRRLAVSASSFGWRGDVYSLYLLDAAVEPLSLLKTDENGQKLKGPNPILEDLWAPPLVLRDASTGEFWFIEGGEPYEWAPVWKVHTVKSGAASSPCRIGFHPPARSALSAFPPVVGRWAAALDEALGPGSGEGTLQQTAGRRSAAARAWGNASIRPWAVADEPYNTRAEVEAGLRQWAAQSKKRAAVWGVIRDMAPVEQSLAVYYRRKFALRQEQAQQAGRYIADRMLRAYFAFARGGEAVPAGEANPWPEAVR